MAGLFPEDPRGKPPERPRQEIVGAVLHVLASGSAWSLPPPFPPRKLAYLFYYRTEASLWDTALTRLGKTLARPR